MLPIDLGPQFVPVGLVGKSPHDVSDFTFSAKLLGQSACGMERLVAGPALGDLGPARFRKLHARDFEADRRPLAGCDGKAIDESSFAIGEKRHSARRTSPAKDELRVFYLTRHETARPKQTRRDDIAAFEP